MFKQVALLSTILTWPLISFGALVRLKGAGLACPDWPLCYGKIIPPPGFEIALEVGHRFMASLLGLCIVLLLVLSYVKPQYKIYRPLSWACLLLVCVQGILGGLTVLMKLSPPTVVLHLAGGNLLFVLLIYLTYKVFWHKRLGEKSSPQKKNQFSSLSKMIAGMLLLLFIILISGGANSSTYAGYACAAFPGCHEGSAFSLHVGDLNQSTNYFLPQSRNEWIHMIHRLTAVLGAIGLALGGWFVLYKKNYQKVAVGVWVLLLLELFIGIANALYRVPVPVSLSHTAVAATLVGLLSYSFAKSMHESH